MTPKINRAALILALRDRAKYHATVSRSTVEQGGDLHLAAQEWDRAVLLHKIADDLAGGWTP